MEAVDDLSGLRRALRRRRRVGVVAVTHDDLNARPGRQPPRDGVGAAVGQHVEGPVALQVHDERAVGQAAAEGEIVDADDPWGGRCRRGRTRGEAENGVVADREAEPLREARPSSAAQRQAKLTEVSRLLRGATCVGFSQVGKALRQNVARAVSILAEEAADLQEEDDLSATDWPIHHGALVATLDAGRALPTGRAAGRGRPRGRPHGHSCWGDPDLFHPQPGEMG